MNHQRVLQALEEILPDIKKTGTPETVLLKYASDNNLSPAQLEKMAQTFNVAKSLTYFDKAANRGGTFKVLDPADLVSQYKKPAPLSKAASVTATVSVTKFPGASALQEAYPELTKAAGVTEQELTPKMKAHLQKQAKADAAKAAFYASDAKEFFRRQIVDGVGAVTTMFKRASVNKSDFIDDVLYTFGKEAGELVLKQTLGVDYKAPADTTHLSKRAFDKDMRTNSKRLEALELASDIYEGMVFHKEASVLVEQYNKVAATKADEILAAAQRLIGIEDKSGRKAMDRGENKSSIGTGDEGPADTIATEAAPDGGGGGGGSEGTNTMAKDDPEPLPTYYSPSEKNVDLKPAADFIATHIVDPASKAMKGVKPGAPYKLLKDIADAHAPSYNSAQEDVDTARREIEASTTIARLLQSDPIISEADPETVIDIFNTLQSANPDLVRDPMSLRMALREALQYDAVPAHTLKEHADIRKTKADAIDKETSQTGQSAEYKLNRKGDN
jgi:hypothetical protein